MDALNRAFRPSLRSLTRDRGQSLVEFALVVPILLLLFAMAVDLGRLFYAYVAVENAAKEGAAYGATNPICSDDTRAICAGTNNVEARVTLEAGSLPGGVTPTLIQCQAPNGSPRVPLTECRDGDTYVVRAAHTFDLVTPILGQVLGNSLVLTSEARSRVLNLAFDPTPGASVVKEACAGANCTDFDVTPITDENNVPQYLEVDSGSTITYRITVRNIGGEPLTSATISDSRGALPFGTAGCPSWSSSLAVGATWSCVYSRTAPNTGGSPELLYDNTVTVDATEIQPRQAQAIVNVIAAPPNLAIAKNVHVYQLGGTGAGPAFGSATTWQPHRNTQIPSVEMWFRITVTNTGGQDATSFSLVDSSGALPVDTNCPARPTTLGPGASYSCRYTRTYTALGTNTETATATAAGGLSASATTTVTVASCSGSDRVIPKLVGRTKTQANNAWTAAGFTGTLTSWSGQNSAIVATQSRDAYSCAAPSSTMTVTR